MSRHLSRVQAIVLGLAVLGGLALGVYVLFAIADRHGLGRDSFTVQAGFADVAGVEVGSRVRIQGMDAGEVEAIVPPAVAGDKVMLRLRVAGKYRHLVAADARVQVGSESLLSGKVVKILPGSNTIPASDGAELAAIPTNDLGEGLADATVKLNAVLNRIDTAVTGLEQGQGSLGLLIKDDTLYKDLTETVGHFKGAMYDLRNGEGTLGKLVKDNEVYAEALASLHDVRKMVTSVKQNSDAIKALPVVRSYVVDAHKELVRPDCKRLRKWYGADELFDADQAVLTSQGKRSLDGIGPWLKSQKEPGSELVVAAFADPKQNADFAQTLTQKQAQAVADYLKANFKVHRTGWWWWSTRPMRAVGVGVNPPPVPETDKLPAARIELLVFVPQN